MSSNGYEALLAKWRASVKLFGTMQRTFLKLAQHPEVPDAMLLDAARRLGAVRASLIAYQKRLRNSPKAMRASTWPARFVIDTILNTEL